MTPTPAGEFRHPIDLQHPSLDRDADGENLQTWTTYATVWASIKPMKGRWTELPVADAIAATATKRIIVRYHPELRITDRVCHAGRTFRINSIDDIEQARRELDLIVTEVVTQ